MTACCDQNDLANAAKTARARRILWIALVLNAVMFAVELTAGLAADSVALQADALDFLGDAATYGISLAVLGLSLRWRAGAAIIKGAAMGLFGLWVLGAVVVNAIREPVPDAITMGWVGALALAVNVVIAILLFGLRDGDANMRSVWLCSRNDVVGNLAVLAAAAGVFGTGTVWPDLAVAALMASLALQAAWLVLRDARREWRLGGLSPQADSYRSLNH